MPDISYIPYSVTSAQKMVDLIKDGYTLGGAVTYGDSRYRWRKLTSPVQTGLRDKYQVLYFELAPELMPKVKELLGTDFPDVIREEGQTLKNWTKAIQQRIAVGSVPATQPLQAVANNTVFGESATIVTAQDLAGINQGTNNVQSEMTGLALMLGGLFLLSRLFK